MSNDDSSPQGIRTVSDALLSAWAGWLGTAGAGGGPLDLVRQSFEPRRWLGPAWSAFDQPFESFLGLPRLAAFPTLDRQIVGLLGGWIVLAQRYGEYGNLVARVWAEAYVEFVTDLARSAGSGDAATSGREVLDRWTAVVNRKLLTSQRSDEFLRAQRSLMDALLSSRGLERNLIEMIAQALDLPTRTEMDDVHRTLHEVKREVRALRRQREADKPQAAGPAPSAGRSSLPQNATRKRKAHTTNGGLGDGSIAD